MQVLKFNKIAKFTYGTIPNKSHIVPYSKYPIFSGYVINGYYDDYNTNENELIIIARGVGGTGNVKFTKTKCWLTNLSIKVNIISDKILPKYLYYKFTKNNLRYLNSGSAQFQITINNLKNLNIVFHDLDTQHHIVDTIGSVDDLIEKNEKIMKSFQNYLQNLFKYYKLKSNKKAPLGQLITKTGTLLKNNEWTNDSVIDLSSMPQDTICITTCSDGKEFTTNIKTLTEDTLLYGSIRPYFHKCGFTTDINYVAGTVHTFRPNNEYLLTYILALISSSEFHEYTNINSQGTKMPIINWDTFCNYNVEVLNNNDMKNFYNETKLLYDKIKFLMKENKKLINIKKLLLSKYFD